MTEPYRRLLDRTTRIALRYLDAGSSRPVARSTAATAEEAMDELVAALGGPLPEEGAGAEEVVESLAKLVEPGLVVTNAGRYFGFVEGGVLPAALAADWLTSVWDQNTAFFVMSPAGAAVEEVCRRWLCDLLGLPPEASAGFTTGAQMANVAGLAAARHHQLARVGGEVESDGLFGAPEITVVVGEDRHATIGRALRLLGLGERRVKVVPADDQGRMRASELARTLGDGPAIVCAQAGNVNSGAFDPLADICDIAHERGAWVHVDGAFGLWAAAAPDLRHLTDGAGRADSWATDGHKWLNVPYDCGIVLCAHPDSHRAALSLTASYLARAGQRDGTDWTPESSRRTRAFAVWAALRSLGRAGLADLVERCCAHARNLASILSSHDGVEVLNDVVLNHVLVRIGDDERTRAVAAAVQADGTAWLGTTQWQGRAALRISVSDQATRDEHVAATAQAIIRAAGLRASG